jgi:lipopolysaccharide/colanic/teichoic acid biosynthesis glycosyltransferase
VIKRLFDLAASGLGLVAASPLLLAATLAIKREDGGPILYGARRVGLHGRPFRMWKFRTMVPNADQIGGPNTADDDPRLTRVGKRLRKYKLDELPQLFNVLVGEMSLVGPRPEVPEYVALYSEDERRLLSVRPGITDWASIRFSNEGEILRGSPDPEKTYFEVIRPEKIRLGLAYVEGHSLVEDLRILLRTARAAFETEKAEARA